jgi:hypothetical protein
MNDCASAGGLGGDPARPVCPESSCLSVLSLPVHLASLWIWGLTPSAMGLLLTDSAAQEMSLWPVHDRKAGDSMASWGKRNSSFYGLPWGQS